jgi:hypothetical protein
VAIDNIPASTGNRELHDILIKLGEVQIDRCRRSSAIAVFTHQAAAAEAVSRLNGVSLRRQRLVVTMVAAARQEERSSSPPTRSRTSISGRPAETSAASHATSGPLVVDGATSSRPRYKGRCSPVDSDTSEDDSSQSDSESECDDNTRSSRS